MLESILTSNPIIKIEDVVLQGIQSCINLDNGVYEIRKIASKHDPILRKGMMVKVFVDCGDLSYCEERKVISCLPDMYIDDVVRTVLRLQ